MGITWDAFDHLLGFFGPILEQLWQSRRGSNPRSSWRKRLLESSDVLGLTLAWIHVPVYHVMLMLTWSLTPGTLSLYLKDGRRCLLCAFKRCHEARVKWPDIGTMRALADLITASQPQLTGVFGFVNGLNLAMYNPPVGMLQNSYCWAAATAAPCCCSGQMGASYGAPSTGPAAGVTQRWRWSCTDDELLKELPEGLSIAADSAFTQPHGSSGH
jgi:hypothetical protein